MRNLKFSLVVLAVVVTGCAGGTSGSAPLPEPTIVADSIVVRPIAPGMTHRWYWMARGPWALNVLDVDRASCWSPVALKGAAGAPGRTRTTTLFEMESAVQQINTGTFVAAAVNGDFFSLATGVPVGAHVHRGSVFAGPVERPSFGVDLNGEPFIGRLALTAVVRHGRDSTIARWNRASAADIAILDGLWMRTDTASGAIELGLHRIAQTTAVRFTRATTTTSSFTATVESIDTTIAGVEIPRGGAVMVIPARADSARRARMLELSIGDTVTVGYAFQGVQPREAVGGFPVLLRNGAIAPETETAGNEGFRNRNPRTAVGLGASGRRMLFVTVDGRQPGYSAGMTLAELADLMRRLGATEALNLDGGGSTTLVLSDSSAHPPLRIANRPSDKEGERPVGNAIAIERSCRDSSAVRTLLKKRK